MLKSVILFSKYQLYVFLLPHLCIHCQLELWIFLNSMLNHVKINGDCLNSLPLLYILCQLELWIFLNSMLNHLKINGDCLKFIHDKKIYKKYIKLNFCTSCWNHCLLLIYNLSKEKKDFKSKLLFYRQNLCHGFLNWIYFLFFSFIYF